MPDITANQIFTLPEGDYSIVMLKSMVGNVVNTLLGSGSGTASSAKLQPNFLPKGLIMTRAYNLKVSDLADGLNISIEEMRDSLMMLAASILIDEAVHIQEEEEAQSEHPELCHYLQACRNLDLDRPPVLQEPTASGTTGATIIPFPHNPGY